VREQSCRAGKGQTGADNNRRNQDSHDFTQTDDMRIADLKTPTDNGRQKCRRYCL
jgi:hypothetical protein